LLSRPEAGEPAGDEESLGGIPFKEDPGDLCPRSGGPAGGAARESKHAPERNTSGSADMPAKTRTAQRRDARSGGSA
jgi:hypothetical protein